MARALQLAQKEIDNQKKLIAEFKPKAEYYDELINREKLTNFRDTAKELHISEKHFIDTLLKKKYTYRDKAKDKEIKPYADKMEFFAIKILYPMKQVLSEPKLSSRLKASSISTLFSLNKRNL